MRNVFLALAGTLALVAGCSSDSAPTISPNSGTVSGRVTNEAGTGLQRTVFVDLNSNSQRDSGEPTAGTNADGAYSITAIPAGTYPVAVELQAGESLASTDTNAREARIVGGTNAAAGAFPWMAQLSIRSADGTGLCGGTLIRPNWVLTAAHCFFESGQSTNSTVTPADVTVRIGSIAIDQGTPFTVRRIVIHPSYTVGAGGELINDVTLLELTTSVTGVPTIPIATSNAQFSGIALARAIGWGATAEGGNTASTLQQVDLPLLNNSQCQAFLSGIYSISDVMICAGGQGGQDSCQGDSGGPLLVTTPSGPLQVGITSYGLGCARPDRPGVYARTSAPLLSGFINTTIGAAPTPTPTPTAVPTFAPIPIATSQPVPILPGQTQRLNFRIRRP